ncbi:MAG: hypothetical protein ACK4WF_06755 [Candidatus Brocadiales bacterium]
MYLRLKDDRRLERGSLGMRAVGRLIKSRRSPFGAKMRKFLASELKGMYRRKARKRPGLEKTLKIYWKRLGK